MVFLSIALLIIITGVVIYFISRPFNQGSSNDISSDNSGSFNSQQMEYEKVLNSLKDLEFEYKLGKVIDTDYKQLKTTYEMKAAEILSKKKEQFSMS